MNKGRTAANSEVLASGRTWIKKIKGKKSERKCVRGNNYWGPQQGDKDEYKEPL